MKDFLISCVIFLMSVPGFGQDKDALLGKWENPNGEGRVEIFKKGDDYYGKIHWLKEPNDEQGHPKTDTKNPDTAKRSRLLQGMVIMDGLDYAGNGVWNDGKVYDPKSGKTYTCKMTLKGEDKLLIRGYIGISLLGRSETWTRVK